MSTCALNPCWSFHPCSPTIPVLLPWRFSLTHACRYLVGSLLQAFAGFPDHPHRGFETCSIMLEGVMEHRDSQGNQVCTQVREAPVQQPAICKWMCDRCARGWVTDDLNRVAVLSPGKWNGRGLHAHSPLRRVHAVPCHVPLTHACAFSASTCQGVIGPGGVQWMTAGRGIIHSEMPKVTDGILWGFQLWINLPKKDKMCKPRCVLGGAASGSIG